MENSKFQILNFQKNVAGFSILEVTIITGIAALLAVMGLGAVHSARNKALLDEGKGSIVHALERSRSRAMSGVGSAKWGVLVKNDEITEFEGESYAAAISSVSQFLPSPVLTDQVATEIIFSRVSGKANSSTTISLFGPDNASAKVSVTWGGAVLSGE